MWPLARLLPAPDAPKTKLSGLNRVPTGDALITSTVPGSRSTRHARGTYRSPADRMYTDTLSRSVSALSPSYFPDPSRLCSAIIVCQNLFPIWFPICTLSLVFSRSIEVVFGNNRLPESVSDLVSALPDLNVENFSTHLWLVFKNVFSTSSFFK